MKKIIASVLLAAVVVLCTACGLDMSKVKGEWTLASVCGNAGEKTFEQIVEESGGQPAQVAVNVTVTDNSFTMTSLANTVTYKINVKSNGFECVDDSNTIVMSVLYDKDKEDTLSFGLQAGSGVATYVMKRGTVDLTISEDLVSGDADAPYEDIGVEG